MFKSIRLFACAIGLLAAISCDKKPERSKDDFRFVNRGDIITLDLNQMSYVQDFRIALATREGLYTFDPATFKPLMALVTSEDVSPDGRTWTFKLRTDAKWSNGDPVTADDFIFSWRNLLESPGQYTYLLYYIEGAEQYQKSYSETGSTAAFDPVGIKAIDPHTLQLKLIDPVPFFRDLLAFPTFYPRHARSMEPYKTVDEKGRASYSPEYTRPPQVVSNGPFKLVEWVPGKSLKMIKDEQYWDKTNVKLKSVEMVVSSDPQSAFIQYDQGQIDWIADVSQDIAYPLKKENRKDLRTSPAFGTAYLTVNCAEKIPELKDQKNPLSDMRVRRAISMAIERATLVNTVTRMGEPQASHYMPPGFFDGYSAKGADPENVDQAKKLLAEAGYPDGKGFPTITIVYNSDNNIRKDLAASLSNQLKQKLGIQVEPRGIELKAYRNEITQKQYSLGLAAWYGDYKDPSTFTDKYLSKSENNDSNWAPPEYDALLAKARKEPDAMKRYAILGEAEGMINQQMPVIPLYHYVTLSLNRDNIKGLYTNSMNLNLFKPIAIE